MTDDGPRGRDDDDVPRVGTGGAGSVNDGVANGFGVAGRNLPEWLLAIGPILLLVAVLIVFAATTPFASFQQGEPLPDVTVTHHTFPDDETIVLHVVNNGPEPVTVGQVLIDEAYWNFRVDGSGEDPRTIAPREQVRVVIPYHWQPGWDYGVDLLLTDGVTVPHEIEAAQPTPGVGLDGLWTLALIGIFVGVIPVAIGMLWLPAIASMSARRLHAVLIFAAGVLAFLAVDAGFEAFELAERVPGVYEGELLVVLGIVGALLMVQAVASRSTGAGDDLETDGGSAAGVGGLRLAYLVALGIGLHNLAEGLAIGSSFALGRVSLGAFLVIGFMLHNVTEGPAVVAPLARGRRPAIRHFLALGAIAGGPVILGGWIGGFAFSPTIGVLFLAIGVGAIIQVDWEIIRMIRSGGGRATTATNLLAFLVGFGVMYATDIFVML